TAAPITWPTTKGFRRTPAVYATARPRHQRTASPIGGEGTQASMARGPRKASMQPQPLRTLIRQSHWSNDQAMPTTISGLTNVAIGQSCHQGPPRPGQRQQIKVL